MSLRPASSDSVSDSVVDLASSFHLSPPGVRFDSVVSLPELDAVSLEEAATQGTESTDPIVQVRLVMQLQQRRLDEAMKRGDHKVVALLSKSVLETNRRLVDALTPGTLAASAQAISAIATTILAQQAANTALDSAVRDLRSAERVREVLSLNPPPTPVTTRGLRDYACCMRLDPDMPPPNWNDLPEETARILSGYSAVYDMLNRAVPTSPPIFCPGPLRPRPH